MTKYLLFILLLSACKTTKYVDRVETKVDSSVVYQRDQLQKTLRETITQYEKEKQQWETTGVVFETLPCPDSIHTKMITKIVFDNGKIKSIEGNVKALNQSLMEKHIEVYKANTIIDSLTVVLDNTKAELAKKQQVLVKSVVRKSIPGWIFLALLLLLIVGIAIEYRLGVARRVINIFKLKL